MTKANQRLLLWQIAVVLLMVVGYSGYYLCRSNLSVLMPLIIDDLVSKGASRDDTKIALGFIASVGILSYAIGKFISGGLADFVGGRRGFVGGMAGIVLFTLICAVSGTMPIFTVAWIGNRFLQSIGWVGMVKITSRWFGQSSYGRVMAIVSLSFLFGDAAMRAFMSYLIKWGLSWRSIFFVGAGVLFVLFVLSFIFLKNSPKDIGEKEPDGPDNHLYEKDSVDKPLTVKELVLPLLKNRSFHVVCWLSLGLTLVREAFSTWAPTYFVESVGLSPAAAAQCSALFPLFGGFSVILIGFLSDRVGRQGRGYLMFSSVALATLSLVALGYPGWSLNAFTAVALIATLAFLLMGPYSLLAGVISLDFGGKRGSATACGLIDGVGYMGGYLAGSSVAKLSIAFGWKGAFLALAIVAGISAILALFYAVENSPSARNKIALTT